MSYTKTTLYLLLTTILVAALGCEVLPVRRLKPTLNNPFPQLTEVAVIPFYNHTTVDSLSGQEVASLFANELSKVPGFNVMPQRKVEAIMIENKIDHFNNVDDIRKLGRLLGVEMVIIGEVHDFDTYYPQRMKLETRWYGVNPYYHYIPVGYALPYGSAEEEMIPDKIIFLAEHELARAQLATQTPDDPNDTPESPKPKPFGPQHVKPTQRIVQRGDTVQQVTFLQETEPGEENGGLSIEELAEMRKRIATEQMLLRSGISHYPDALPVPAELKEDILENPPTEPPLPRFYYGPEPTVWSDRTQNEDNMQSLTPQMPYPGQYPGYPPPVGLTPEQLAQYGHTIGVVPPLPAMYPMMPGMPLQASPDQSQFATSSILSDTSGLVVGEPERFPGLPADWPDPRGFVPDGPSPEKPIGEVVNKGPVMRHITMHRSNDSEFTQALQDYDFLFRDDKRIVSWQSLMSNRGEFIAFCCRLHIWETLSARGGAGKAETVVREFKLWKGGRIPY